VVGLGVEGRGRRLGAEDYPRPPRPRLGVAAPGGGRRLERKREKVRCGCGAAGVGATAAAATTMAAAAAAAAAVEGGWRGFGGGERRRFCGRTERGAVTAATAVGEQEGNVRWAREREGSPPWERTGLAPASPVSLSFLARRRAAAAAAAAAATAAVRQSR
jgi:hypothetical protein